MPPASLLSGLTNCQPPTCALVCLRLMCGRVDSLAPERPMRIVTLLLSLACCLIIIACSSDTAPTESAPSAVTISQQVEVGDPVRISISCIGPTVRSLNFEFEIGVVGVLFDEGLAVNLVCSPILGEPAASGEPDPPPRNVSVVVDDVGGSWQMFITLQADNDLWFCLPGFPVPFAEGTTLPAGPVSCTIRDTDAPFQDDLDEAVLRSGVVVNMN